jgi:hypothetical protein
MNTTTREEHLTTADVAGIAKGEEWQREDGSNHPLFLGDVATEFQTKWNHIQTGFVDEPRKAVEEADELVALAIKRLAEKFAEERSRLERQWDRGDQVNTEDLRLALQTYRSFFHRLLSL